MINLNRIKKYKEELKDKTPSEKENLLYELINAQVISLGEFQSLFSTINIKEKNEY